MTRMLEIVKKINVRWTCGQSERNLGKHQNQNENCTQSSGQIFLEVEPTAREDSWREDMDMGNIGQRRLLNLLIRENIYDRDGETLVTYDRDIVIIWRAMAVSVSPVWLVLLVSRWSKLAPPSAWAGSSDSMFQPLSVLSGFSETFSLDASIPNSTSETTALALRLPRAEESTTRLHVIWIPSVMMFRWELCRMFFYSNWVTVHWYYA